MSTTLVLKGFNLEVISDKRGFNTIREGEEEEWGEELISVVTEEEGGTGRRRRPPQPYRRLRRKGDSI